MGVFRFFEKNKAEPTDEQKKWNKMWHLWAEGRADSPYAELMTYQSEINNGGHDLTNEESGEQTETMLSQYDDVFYRDEEEINCVLRAYAFKIGS